jgi:CBS domain-containing protein
MKVQDIMAREVQCCGPDTNLAVAAKMMWDSDCGVLPVLNIEGKVMGVVTDRDICMSAATKNKPASEITVWESIAPRAYTCRATDDIQTALDIMRRHQVRRLPVVDEDGVLEGIISVNDLILRAGEAKGAARPELSLIDVMRTLKAIHAHRVLAGL